MLLVSCGGYGPDPSQAEATVRAYLQGVYAWDDDAACGQLSDPAEADLVEVATFPGPPESPADCAEALALLGSIGSLDRVAAGVMDLDRVHGDGADQSIEVVDVESSSATLRVAGSEKTVTVSASDGGEWLIDRLDFSDVPGE